jgi:DNA-directed RNA polymerase specialized sigma24 family protein
MANRPVGPNLPLAWRQPAASCPDSSLRRTDVGWTGWPTGGVDHERTCRELHALLLRAAKFEVVQRRIARQVGGADLDDLAFQAASDALLLVIRKAREFRGESRFTTWATRFVGFEVHAKLRQHASRHRTVGLGPEHDEQLVAPNSDPYVHAEAQELAEAIRGVVNDQFSAKQRSVFLALLRCDATPANLGLQAAGSPRHQGRRGRCIALVSHERVQRGSRHDRSFRRTQADLSGRQ